MNVPVVKTQYFKDLDTHLVYVEPQNSYSDNVKHRLYYKGVLVTEAGWHEIKEIDQLLAGVFVTTKNAHYRDPESAAEMEHAAYVARCKELRQQAYEKDEEGEKVVLDAHAYSLLKELKKWTYIQEQTEEVRVAPDFKQVVTNFHHRNLFLKNAMIDGDMGQACLWVYDRASAIHAHVKEFMDEHGVEQLPVYNGFGAGTEYANKQWRFSTTGEREGRLKSLGWMSAWGSYVFRSPEIFEYDKPTMVATEEECLKAYEVDRKRVFNRLQLEYNKRWGSVSFGAGHAKELLEFAKNAYSQLAGIRERRDSKGSASGARAWISKLQTRLEEIIRG